MKVFRHVEQGTRIFFQGAGETMAHGVMALGALSEPMQDVMWNLLSACLPRSELVVKQGESGGHGCSGLG